MENTTNGISPGEPARLSDDLIWGVKGIADFIGKTERQAFHLATTGQIPTGKIGGRLVASRSALRRFFADIVAGQVG
jgi:hypothetical protein